MIFFRPFSDRSIRTDMLWLVGSCLISVVNLSRCVCALLTLANMPSVEGSCHPSLLVVTRATTITALATCVVFTFTAELLHKNTEEKETL